MFKLFLAVILANSQSALAYPSFFSGVTNGCEVPSASFGNHGAPVANDQMKLSLTDASGSATESWTADGVYTVTLTSADSVHAWVHASLGTLAPLNPETHAQAEACSSAAYSTALAPSHAFTWTAPSADDECVVVVAAGAKGETAAYETNTAVLPGANVQGECPQPEAVVPSSAPHRTSAAAAVAAVAVAVAAAALA